MEFLQIKLWLLLSHNRRKSNPQAEETYSRFPVGQCPTRNLLPSWLLS